MVVGAVGGGVFGVVRLFVVEVVVTVAEELVETDVSEREDVDAADEDANEDTEMESVSVESGDGGGGV